MDKTLFFGNGLNYLSDNPIGWEQLLDKVMGDEKFDTNSLPYLMTYERIRLNWNKSRSNKKSGISHLKVEIAKILESQEPNRYFEEALNIGVRNFLTTNYDYALNKAFNAISVEDSSINNSTEDLYSIRRNTSLINKNGELGKIWNIHGELKYPKSIMLGINHYCGSVGKIDGYLKGTYNFTLDGKRPKVSSIEEKLKTDKFDGYSWLELFFNSNVHMAGFGLDFSEIDIWWILNKRARLNEHNLIKNKIVYYTKPLKEVKRNLNNETRKRELLKSFGVEIETYTTKNGYEEQWSKILNNVKTSR